MITTCVRPLTACTSDVTTMRTVSGSATLAGISTVREPVCLSILARSERDRQLDTPCAATRATWRTVQQPDKTTRVTRRAGCASVARTVQTNVREMANR